MRAAASVGRIALLAIHALLAAAPAWAGPSDASPTAPLRIAADIYVFPGVAEAPTAANLGRVANVGVIVGADGVIVVGSGSSDADGERLIEAIRRISPLPVVLAIDTYAGPEHVLGNAAFARRGIPILAHRATDRYMALNCDACQRSLQRLVGDAALAATRPERPRQLIDGPTSLVAGGRKLELLYYGPTQQPGSIAVFDPAGGVLFAGGLASFDVVPDARDADLGAWIAALASMRRLPLKRVVPAHGSIAAPERLDELIDYLAGLAGATQSAYERGLGLAEATLEVQLPRFRGWAMYAQTHPRNVHFQYLQIEARELGVAPPPQ
jgi:glyoxylase-like metal-dependent hydrolase (beta-lactamase superfamily II)